ncbi:hypothetical protein COBT_000509 [Conglomerata obtusa]
MKTTQTNNKKNGESNSTVMSIDDSSFTCYDDENIFYTRVFTKQMQEPEKKTDVCTWFLNFFKSRKDDRDSIKKEIELKNKLYLQHVRACMSKKYNRKNTY